MSKASVTDITNMGFAATQFGNPSNWSDTDGYIDSILKDQALVVADRVGATVYADASNGSLTFARLKMAETYLTVAELWRRMEQFEAANVAIGRGETPPSVASRLLNNARKAEEIAEEQLLKITNSGDSNGGLAVGYVETGPYASVTT